MKQSPEKFTLRIERLTNVKAQEQEIKFEEDSISIKVNKLDLVIEHAGVAHLKNTYKQNSVPRESANPLKLNVLWKFCFTKGYRPSTDWRYEC